MRVESTLRWGLTRYHGKIYGKISLKIGRIALKPLFSTITSLIWGLNPNNQSIWLGHVRSWWILTIQKPSYEESDHFPRIFALLCFNKTLLCFNKTLLCFNKTLLCFDKTLLCFDKTLLWCEKTVLWCEKILLWSEKILLLSLIHISDPTRQPII